MRTELFRASVQYNDSKGTAAADDHDQHTIKDHMKAHGLIQDGDTVVGVRIWSGEVHGSTQNKPVSVMAYVIDAAGFEEAARVLDGNGALDVREVRFEMDLADFFGLFKRFEISISRFHQMTGRELNIQD
ncbi:hypothetical protein [Pseudomonas syringae]|uniref:Uncharacterized protein n=3 Tax=Pseudomonas syringae TaxID=317 RepID=A0A656JI39_PSESF|nr:hypothetical protein [Pseudomonas syringae]EPN26390.1 hypothetical protein A245_48310 [Pseudomonas syringae pv. actinidiae ICMP 19096]EPM44229.1 hypothetical protein A246_23686 [Pseudomonas syringae pv. actinidiae ICMP 19098]EPM67254.1 hypothetical protein A249_40192 [Pseudomonas syringae pv. actinidiae ICMP 18804]EPN15323.1 hypothetical protein A248_23262 [Pseudomonas syringae pv. actinidiae ICMP 19100]EPN23771.1 hypothetical protein A247_23635 [Pseudomonas syringae pv. actinidiae ICMP 190